MTISSRTPDGTPHHCPVCGRMASLQPSYPGGDSVCPSCGQLLWYFRDRLGGGAALQCTWDELGADSLDAAEFFMELEDQLGISISLEDAAHLKTIADVIRYIQELRGDEAA